MKKLFLFFAVCLSLSASAQFSTPPYMRVSATGYWWDQPSAFSVGLHLPAFGDTALTSKQSRRAGAVLIDTVGDNKGLYYWMDGHWNQVTGGVSEVDSLLYSTRAWRQKGIDSVMGIVNTKQAAGNYITGLTGDGTASGPGSSVFTLTNTGVLAGSYSIPNITVNSKGQVTDIASGPAIPAQFNPIAGTNMAFTGTYPNITFNASGGSGNPNSNVGSAFRLAIPNTNNIKTLNPGLYMLADSATSNQINIKVDTATMFPQLRSTIPPAGGSGTVTSVATNSGTGITGGPITSTGTLAIDTTSTIQKKLAFTPPVTKNNNTLSLAGWSAILPNSVYGADASGVGVMRRAAIIDTALRRNGWSVVWDSVNSKHVYQYITGSGGGSSGIRPKWLLMQVGVSYNAIAAGTTTIVHDSLIGHGVELAIDGHAMQPNSSEADGYTYTPGTGTIELVTPVMASSKIRILRINDNIDTLTAQPPPAVWQYMAFTSPTLFTNTSNVYTASSGSGWGSYALGTTPFIGDMSIRTQHVSSAQEYIVGLRTTNVAGDFTGYYVGYAVTGGVLYRLESGSSGSLSYSMSANEYARIVRSGSTFLIQVSMDGNTWTTKHTSSNTGSGTYYVNLNMYAQSPLGKAYYMMYK